ncbi:hypothetical protein PRSY57_1210000 [Plasmodium reichenowi]|uniref:Uncharacterized protein n=1 Tax=Plasmodium reichenowi TaxID=5854 RepID=A0A151L8D9_PLARE|nr:hypothetical protein PRSY57_1210000 [Plasmodium reichenowi]KYN95220.1 hypothetical protein PRSY57_1210000 [Plasmodium reichenowi]
MLNSGGEHVESERRPCLKYLISLLLLLMLMLILRKQNDEEEEMNNRNKMNLRKNENYRNYTFGYMRDISYFKYSSVIYITPNRRILPSITYIDKYTIYVNGYDNILNNFKNISLSIDQKKDDIYISSSYDDNYNIYNDDNIYNNDNIYNDDNIYMDNIFHNDLCKEGDDSNKDCAIINTILVDKYLFKNMKISNCNEEIDILCFLVFVQLNKKKCYSFDNLSYSCHINNNIKNKNLFLLNNYCYVLLASSSIHKIYEFIKLELLNKEEINDNTKNEHVQIVTHFCGNMINQIAMIDYVNTRILFIQRYIKHTDNNNNNINDLNINDLNINDLNTNDLNTNDLNTYDLNTNDLNTNDLNTNDLNTNDHNNRMKGKSIELNLNEENKNNLYDTFNNDIKNTYETNLNFKLTYYLSIINMNTQYKDNIEYVDYINNKLTLNLFPPIYIGYDETSNFYYIIQYENKDFLTIIFISPITLTTYYTLKITDFYSGWLLIPKYYYENKGLILLGEYPPYEDELHVWDITNIEHSKYFVNVIKAYSNI